MYKILIILVIFTKFNFRVLKKLIHRIKIYMVGTFILINPQNFTYHKKISSYTRHTCMHVQVWVWLLHLSAPPLYLSGKPV